MNARLAPLLDELLKVARGHEGDERAASLLVSLLRRYRRRANAAAVAHDTRYIAEFFGDEAARIRVTRRDVAAVIETVVASLEAPAQSTTKRQDPDG